MTNECRICTHFWPIVLGVAWLGIAWLIMWPTPSPWVSHPGDSVTPAKVAAGGRVTVLRKFTIIREATILVTRRLANGDCTKRCIYVDLPSSTVNWVPGEYVLPRDHVIPIGTVPGVWRMEFFIHWESVVGRKYSSPLTVLEIEVI